MINQFELFASLILFTAYIIYAIVVYFKKTGKLLPSISESAYHVPLLVFVLFISNSCGFISYYCQELLKTSLSVTSVSSWLLSGIAAFALMHDCKTSKVHNFLAISGFLGILAGGVIDFKVYIPLIITALLGVIVFFSFKSKPCKVLMLEMLAIGCAWINFYIITRP